MNNPKSQECFRNLFDDCKLVIPSFQIKILIYIPSFHLALQQRYLQHKGKKVASKYRRESIRTQYLYTGEITENPHIVMISIYSSIRNWSSKPAGTAYTDFQRLVVKARTPKTFQPTSTLSSTLTLEQLQGFIP
jgi:hypothetical protein